MKLTRKIDKILNCVMAVSVAVVVGALVGMSDRATFAVGEQALVIDDAALLAAPALLE